MNQCIKCGRKLKNPNARMGKVCLKKSIKEHVKFCTLDDFQ
jgi:hypothetical protein